MSGPSNASMFFEKMRRIPFTVWTLAIVGVCGGIGYGVHNGQYQRQRPQPRIARIVEGIDRRHQEALPLPKTMGELTTLLQSEPWKNVGQRTGTLHNYLYTYYQLDAEHATLWAVPLGKYRDEGATYLLIIRRRGYEIWKGRTLPPRESELLAAEPVPTFAQLSMYGLERVYSNESTARR